MNSANKLQKRIMRRIYMAFAVRLATHQMTAQIGLFILALYIFGEMVHVRQIVETLLNTPLGRVPTYVGNAFMHGEMLTLLAIGTMVFVALSVPLQLRSYFGFRTHST